MLDSRFARVAAVAVAGAMGLVVTAAAPPHATPSDADVNCRAVTTRDMERLRADLRTAHDAADADHRANGSSGAYAIAATNSRDLIQRAIDQADAMIAKHRGSDPRTVTPAEGGTFKEHTRAIIEVLPEAAHWAMVSEIYHDSQPARAAFEGAVAALARGQEIFVNAGRCYMEL